MYDTYIKKIAEIYNGGDYTEHSFRSPFQELLETFAKQEISRDVKIVHEASREKFGAPDFKIKNASGNVIGYIECKNIDEDIEKLSESDQIKKYLDISDNFILTDYLEFLMFRNGEIVSDCQISRKMRLSGKNPQFENIDKFREMFALFFSADPEPVKNSRKLSAELAKRTRILRELIYDVLKTEEKSPFKKLFPVFKKTVMPDLDLFAYADIYAETIGFGLFFLRLSKNQPLTKENILSGIPHYIPLLRDFFPVTRFDEWQENIVWILDEIIGLLNAIDTEYIRASLSYKSLSLLKPREANLRDPFIYFYEEFLNIYDKTRKIEKGVFYTPEAVVSHIIRSLDIILKENLDVKAGFLDTSIKILDFATGTGTFIITLIEYIREQLYETNNMGLFNTTTTEFILKNIYGFELLVVPYIICHLRIHEFLENSGFAYMGDMKERAEIYLTNALDDIRSKPTEIFDKIDMEGQLADRVKHEEELLVIMGNPPYSVSSSNDTEFIRREMERYKKAVKSEKNIQPLSDDYIKFIRFAHWKMEQVKKGVCGIITNNSFADGLIHRGMREELMKTFDEIYILNLRGNANRGDVCPDGSKDENVFDIRQGVCISFFVKTGKKINKKKGVYYYSLQGLREKKYAFLYENTIRSVRWEKLKAVKPDFWFVEKDFQLQEEYNNSLSIQEIFSLYNTGLTTFRDNITIHFSKEALENIKNDFIRLKPEKLIQKYQIQNSRDWNLADAIEDLKTNPSQIKFLYRPFDYRHTYYSGKVKGFISYPRKEIMKSFLNRENLGLSFCRQIISKSWQHVLIIDTISERCFVSLKTREATYIAPLYIYPDEEIQVGKPDDKTPNFTQSFQKHISTLYKFRPEPEQIMGYIYAILYAPAYRTKYYEFLKTDFPRIPFTEDEKLFRKLSEKGTELINLHLLKTHFEKSVVNFPVEKPDLKVESVRFGDNQVWINATTYFDNIPEAVWKYEIGGYQVLDKWLKERKKHKYTLTGNDIRHFINICNALNETIKIQADIDKLVKDWI